MFNEIANKTMEFLHYQYPQPVGSVQKSLGLQDIEVDPRHSLVHKVLDHPFSKNKKEKIRIDINVLLHSLIISSEDEFQKFEDRMVSIFQQLERDKKVSSAIEYRFSKRLSKNKHFKSMSTKSAAFTRTDKETISVLMDWY